MPLTDIQARNAKPADRDYKLADSGGLYLLVRKNGSRLWRQKYRFDGKEKLLSHGAYPQVGVSAARQCRDRAKEALSIGVDPGAAATPARTVADSFEEVGRDWFARQTATLAGSYSARILSRLEGDIFPEIGGRAIADIEPPELLAAIRKIEERGAIELAKRVKNYCGRIFRFAIAEGKCRRDPSADITDALRPAPRKKRRAWIRANQMPEFRTRLDQFEGEAVTKLALQAVVLTVLRTNEIRYARKAELEDLDGEEPLWRIPGHRMKIKGIAEHLVPLSRQAAAVLKGALALDLPGPLLFPSTETRDGALSQNTMLYALYSMGYHSRATVHGFRTTFSTAANEARREDGSRMWDFDAIERQLAHVEQDEVRASYNAAEYLSERRRLMQWWADQIWAADDFDALLC